MAGAETTRGTRRSDAEARAALRALPAVSTLLPDPAVRALAAGLPQEFVVRAAQAEVDAARARILADGHAGGDAGADEPVAEAVRECLLARLRLLVQPKLQPIVNATGVI